LQTVEREADAAAHRKVPKAIRQREADLRFKTDEDVWDWGLLV
jgi:hypothetical protein